MFAPLTIQSDLLDQDSDMQHAMGDLDTSDDCGQSFSK
jgi:hypothetical protein